MPHLGAAILGLAAVLHTSSLLFAAVKWAGVAYLLWLAWHSPGRDGARSISADRHAETGPRIAGRGALINPLNPKLSVFFLALLPPLLSGDPSTAAAEMTALGAAFMALTFAVFALHAAMAAAARDRLAGSGRALRAVNRSLAALFAALAGRLALERSA